MPHFLLCHPYNTGWECRCHYPGRECLQPPSHCGSQQRSDAGATETSTAATVLTMTTNAAWELKAALSGTWTSPGSYDKDENDLLIRITNTPTGTIQNGAGSYITLSGADLPILTHGSAVTAEDVDIQTKVLLDWTQDIPGTYSLTVLYTLVAPVV